MLQNNIVKRLGMAAVVAAMAFVHGCKLPAELKQANEVKTPGTYLPNADTGLNLAYRKDFFADSLLKRLISDALAGNFDLLAAQQRVEMARSNVLLSRAALAPTVGLNTYASEIKYGRHTMDGAGNATTPEVPSPIVPSYMLGIGASWEADLWGKLKKRKQAAQLRYYGTQMGKNLLTTTLLAEIAYRYYDLVAWDEQLKIINNNIKLQQLALDLVQVQKNAGKANELAVKQFSAQLLRTRALQYNARQEIKRLENELLMLAGKEGSSIPRDTSIYTVLAGKIESAGVPGQLLRNRPDVVQAELMLQASKADVAAARASFLPSFIISGNVGYNTYHPELMFNPVSFTFGMLGTLAGPLLNRRTINAAYKQSVAENNEAYYQYAKAVQGAVYEVRTILSEIANLQQQYELTQKETRELKEAIGIAKELYLAGYASYLEVVSAQQSALEAELKLVDTRRKLLVSNVNLYRALGGGWQ